MEINCLGKCDRCCRYVRVPVSWDKDYIKARGFREVDGLLEIPHICPQLKDGKCKLKVRPKACINNICNEWEEMWKKYHSQK
jgi:hypothetical protein